jgi:hypothetical protein
LPDQFLKDKGDTMAGYIIGDQAYVTCDDCGKPITVVTEIGMFCEDLCGIEESKGAGKEINALIEKLLLKEVYLEDRLTVSDKDLLDSLPIKEDDHDQSTS